MDIRFFARNPVFFFSWDGRRKTDAPGIQSGNKHYNGYPIYLDQSLRKINRSSKSRRFVVTPFIGSAFKFTVGKLEDGIYLSDNRGIAFIYKVSF